MHFYFPFPPYSLSHISLPNLLKIHSFFFTNWYWNHVCIYILKYYLLRPNKSTCMYAFRVDCFALGNQLLCSSLGKTTSTIPNFGIAAACKSLNGWSLVVFANTLLHAHWNYLWCGHIWAFRLVRLCCCSFWYFKKYNLTELTGSYDLSTPSSMFPKL